MNGSVSKIPRGDDWDDLIRRNATKPMTMENFAQFFDVFKEVMDGVKKRNGERDTKIEALETKVRELEARPTGAKYCGVWQDSLEYMRDDAVTKGGSLWIAKHNHVKSEPGVDHVSWQLAVQRGRDGRSTR